MAPTNAYVHDRHRQRSGVRSGVFEPCSREHGTTSVDALVAAAALRPHQIVLDRGCGEGPRLGSVTWREVRDLGMDVSASSVAAARPLFGATEAAFMAADAGQMPRDQEN
jgi:cyclopropane fatty-acyl-phospholipid synthase-like methyltransferase